MEQQNEQRVAEFLDELSALTRKHKIVIGGCGCCGSPFLEVLDEEVPGSDRYKADSGDRVGDPWRDLEHTSQCGAASRAKS